MSCDHDECENDASEECRECGGTFCEEHIREYVRLVCIACRWSLMAEHERPPYPEERE